MHTKSGIATVLFMLVQNIDIISVKLGMLISPQASQKELARPSLMVSSLTHASLAVLVKVQLLWMLKNNIMLALIINIGIT